MRRSWIALIIGLLAVTAVAWFVLGSEGDNTSASVLPKQGESISDYLTNPRDLITKKQYQEAHQRFIWFYDHALEFDQSIAGVRNSFFLNYWKELGFYYPKAKKAMIAARNRRANEIRRGKGDAATFRDVVALNSVLQEQEETITLFTWLDKNRPQEAKAAWMSAKSDIIAAQRYDIVRRYITDIDAEFSLIKARYTSLTQNELLKNNEVSLASLGRMFVNDVLELIKVTVAIDGVEKARQIHAQALAVLDDPALRQVSFE